MPRPFRSALRVRLGFPAVHLGKFALQLRGADPVLVGEVLLRVDRVLLLHDLIEALISHDDRIEDLVRVVLEVILLQEGDPVPGRDRDAPGRGVQLPGKDLQERGLSGSVRADQAVAVPLGKLDVDIFKKRLFPDAVGNVVGSDHSSSPVSIRSFFVSQTHCSVAFGKWKAFPGAFFRALRYTDTITNQTGTGSSFCGRSRTPADAGMDLIREDAMAKPKTSQQDLILSLAALALIAALVLASQLQNR